MKTLSMLLIALLLVPTACLAWAGGAQDEYGNCLVQANVTCQTSAMYSANPPTTWAKYWECKKSEDQNCVCKYRRTSRTVCP